MPSVSPLLAKMKKRTIHIAAGLLTFSMGTLAATWLALRHPAHEEVLFQAPQAIRVGKLPFAGPWKRIKVGHVSFAIPASLKTTGLPGKVGVVEAMGGPFVDQDFLYVNYSYGKRVGRNHQALSAESSELQIDGKRATLYITKFEEYMLVSLKDRPGMEMFVPDVSDGRTGFELYAVSFDVDLIRQIMDSVEIR
jgi:hypothetical protein